LKALDVVQGKSKQQSRTMTSILKMTSKGVGINLLSLDLFLLVDTLMLMLWID